MVYGKQKFALWLRPDAKSIVEQSFREDNCASQSEYIEKAIRFYSGYCHGEQADNYLPVVLSATLEGHLNLLGDRVGKLLYKLAVEQSILMHIIAADTDLDEETLEKLRYRCVRDVNRTGGMISFRDILRFQKSE